jgi:dTDP-4-dehydrorhamnose 3,5-epimerase
MLKVNKLPIDGLLIIEPKSFSDERGYFFESWNLKNYTSNEEYQINDKFVQDNISFSSKGVLRGLHCQSLKPQAKLVNALQGEIYDVAVDLRPKSKTYGQWHSEILSDENKKQFYIPAGFAHGFLVLSETALIMYKCDEFYYPEYERSLQWNDKDLNINWPLNLIESNSPIVSAKDQKGISFIDFQSLNKSS